MGRQRVGALAGHVVCTGPAARMGLVGRLLEIPRCAVTLEVVVKMLGALFAVMKTTNQ